LGGLIIVGLSLVVRRLQRIEHALVTRPMPRAARPGEAIASPAVGTVANGTAATGVAVAPAPAPSPALESAAAPEKAAQAPRIPFPQRPRPESRPQHVDGNVAAPTPAAAAAEETAFERLRQKFPSLARIDSAPVVEATEVSLSPRTPARTDEYAADARTAPPPRRVNGAAPAPPAKAAMFDSLWPKDQRAAQQVVPTADEPGPPPPHAAEPDLRQADIHAVSILKSGVVDGMAYTLYSDGSIEAQLPQGTMRFGSITELRNHLERNG
jgi:hypothetical protein